jgi:TetR/AcrR family fatty acid metabolism transcriptional regulator
MMTSPEPQTDSPVRRDKRKRILDAAVCVFARMGYHGARVSDIAREAGIAYGLVYHYFKNKEEILNTIFEDRWGGFREAVDGIAAGRGTTEDKLVSITALILGAHQIHPDWVKVFVLEILRSSRFAEPGSVRAVVRLFQAVTSILRSGQESGELRGDLDPEIACFVFIGSLELVISGQVLGLISIDEVREKESEYYVKVARTVVEIFLRGFSASPSATGGVR